jgi:hypothetical protein
MATSIPGIVTTLPGIVTSVPGMATAIPGTQPKVVTFAPESVVTFDRNRWSRSTGTGGHLAPEYAASGYCQTKDKQRDAR